MSYFVFGVAEPAAESDAASFAAAVAECASAAGIFVRLGGADEPPLLPEMRNASSASGVPFWCVRSPGDDVSDGIASPFLLGVEGAASGLGAVARWATRLLDRSIANSVTLWVTDGFDDTFESTDCAASELEERLVQMVRATGDHPSLLIRVSPRPDHEAAR